MDRPLHIDFLGFGLRVGFDDGRSASLFGGFAFLWKPEAQPNGKMNDLNNHSMCRGSNVKDTSFAMFQLESLILAQNERWRQA